MNRLIKSQLNLLLIFSCSLLLISSCTGKGEDDKPNIIYILADDLGYGELGSYGQTRIETPHLDALAESGMRFTNHYSGSAVCAPSRSVLLTGLHTGHTQIRGNDEWADRGAVWDYRAMIADSVLEGQRPLLPGTVTIGTLLQKAGYTTALVGKWGLGAPHTESIPNKMGFDFFFGYNCQRQAHTYYPVHLYRNESRVWLKNDTVAPGTKLAAGADPLNNESYNQFQLNEYAPDLMFDEIIGFVNENKRGPFFLYWATPIPHNPLQAPESWVSKYVDKFGDEPPYLGDKGYFPHRYPHAAYAAMVSYLDYQVGELISELKRLGIYENTLIIFSSDNGPTWSGGADSPWFNSGGPYRSEAGFGKGSLNEGGIKVPMIASWPGKIKAGAVSEHQSAFWDMMATFSEAGGVEEPLLSDGISFLPELTGRKQRKHDYLYWEFPESGGQQAVIIGEMKAIRKNMHKGNTTFELYNLKSDPQELKDVSHLYPEIIERVNSIVAKEHTPSDNRRWQFAILDGDR